MSDGAAIVGRELVYDGWYKFWRLAVRMPDGAVVERHLEDHGRAASVLPYDPARRVATLVSLPRAPVMAAGAPPLLETIAGNLHRDPEETARTEALEEAGLRLGALEFVAEVWAMPALSTERLSLFLAPYAAADRIGAGGGLAHEHESVTVHEVPLAELRRQARSGALPDGKTLILLQALELRRPELFA